MTKLLYKEIEELAQKERFLIEQKQDEEKHKERKEDCNFWTEILLLYKNYICLAKLNIAYLSKKENAKRKTETTETEGKKRKLLTIEPKKEY